MLLAYLAAAQAFDGQTHRSRVDVLEQRVRQLEARLRDCEDRCDARVAERGSTATFHVYFGICSGLLTHSEKPIPLSGSVCPYLLGLGMKGGGDINKSPQIDRWIWNYTGCFIKNATNVFTY